MIRLRLTLIVCVISLLVSMPAWTGQPDKNWKDWFGHVSGGYAMAQGTFGDIVDDDFSLAGGATYWPEDWPVGIDLELSYNDMDLSSAALRAINDAIDDDPANDGEVTGGDVEIWALTTNAIWSPDTGSISPYVTAGVGVYYLDAKITSDALIYYPPYCDPWYWWCYPGGVTPGTVVEGSQSTTEFGYNFGAGINFELASGSQVYLEAKYHGIETDREETELIPLVVGFRW